MKKYIAPSLQVVNIDAQAVMMNVSGETTINDEGGVQSRGLRRGTLTDWDDDED